MEVRVKNLTKQFGKTTAVNHNEKAELLAFAAKFSAS